MLQDQFSGSIMALGDNLKRLRRDKQWTQGELAERSGIKVGHISKLERNESDPKLETLSKLMHALDCSPNALLSDVGTTSLDGVLEMALERVQALPEEDKTTLLRVIDRYCMAVGMQGLMDSSSQSSLFGLTIWKGSNEEMSK